MDARNSRFNQVTLAMVILLFLFSLFYFTYLSWSVENELNLWILLLNGFILMIPLGLLYGGLYLLVTVWRQRQLSGQIDPKSVNLIHWAPRLAAILIIFFFSLFSLDVFSEKASPLVIIGGLIMHNIPSIAMIVALIFAWRRPLVGFFVFLLAGLFFLGFVILRQNLKNLEQICLLSAPLLIVSVLFYADWRWIKKPVD